MEALQVQGGGAKVLGTLIKSVFLYSLAILGWRGLVLGLKQGGS